MAKNVIITGAAGGLGTAVVQKFIEDGYHVFAVTQPGHPQQAERLKNISQDEQVLSIDEVDVLNAEETASYVQKIAQKHQQIDAAIMIVGGYAGGDFLQASTEDIDKMISLNFKSAYNIAVNCYPQMEKQNGGTLVFISARPALEASMGIQAFPYALSKGMVKHLAELMHTQGKSKNISTAVIVPFIIDTPANREGMPDANFDTWTKPSEIADVIAFACSDKAKKLDYQLYQVYGHA